MFELAKKTGERKFRLTILFSILVVGLGTLDAWKEVPEITYNTLTTIFLIGVGGNVGSKIAKTLPDLFAALKRGDQSGKA